MIFRFLFIFCTFLFHFNELNALEMKSARVGIFQGNTRFVLDLDQKTPFSYFTLHHPYRVVIDFPKIKKVASLNKISPVGIIKGIRDGLFQDNVHRFVLDVSSPPSLSKPFFLKSSKGSGYRLVFDIKRTSEVRFALQSKKLLKKHHRWKYFKPQMLSSSKKMKPEKTVSTSLRRRKHVIVIDPGHGGVDPGAVSKNGIYEKHLTLKVAQALKKSLEKTGRFKVVLTRNRDIFISLGRRVNMARHFNASLFISLHVDSIHKPGHRGASVYTLSETASDKEAARLARKENKSDMIAGVNFSQQNSLVQSILVDFARRQTMNLSARFASQLIKSLDPVILLQKRHHRFAGFAVLKSSSVPSVLFEMGYISNKKDLKLLRSSRYVRKLSQAMVRAIDRYFLEIDRLTHS